MRELIRTNDIVRLRYLQAILEEAGIPTFVFDDHMSFTEGSIGILAQRLMVADEWEARARELLAEADRSAGDGQP